MPLETATWVGRSFPPHEVTVTPESIAAFAAAVGEDDLSEAPPTYPIYLDLSAPAASARLQSLGIPMENVLHAEQGFTSHRPIVAGMTLSCSTTLTALSEKKGGTLLITTFETTFEDADGLVAEMQFTLAVRNTE